MAIQASTKGVSSDGCGGAEGGGDSATAVADTVVAAMNKQSGGTPRYRAVAQKASTSKKGPKSYGTSHGWGLNELGLKLSFKLDGGYRAGEETSKPI